MMDETQGTVSIPETVEQWHRVYQRGFITLGELVEELTRLDLRYGPHPFSARECDCDYWHSKHRWHCATNYAEA